MLPGVLLAMLQSCLYLRLYYRNIDELRLNEPKELRELRREIKVWQRALNAIAACSKDAQLVRGTLLAKVKQLKRTLRRKQRGVGSTEIYTSTLDELKQKVGREATIYFFLINLSFPFTVSHQEQEAAAAICVLPALCHRLLLHPIGAALEDATVGLGGSAWRNPAANHTESRGYGASDTSHRVDHFALLCRHVCDDGVRGAFGSACKHW